MDEPFKRLTGRGSQTNTGSRFDSLEASLDLTDYGWMDPDEQTLLQTEFFRDPARTVLTRNNSPDIPFRYSVNPYRGCEHGCAYCYARPTHEYLGLSAGLDFESKIFYKENAPELLRKALLARGWQPETISMSGVTDCYQPVESRFELTRRCLQVLAEFRNPVSLITKNKLILRDLDVLEELASDQCVAVFISITTLDAALARKLEPRTSSPQARVEAIRALSTAGIPVGVNVAPVIPGLTDHELPRILESAAQAGARFAGFVPLRLPHSLTSLFAEWLEVHAPDRKERVLNTVRSLRGGELNDSRFGSRMQGSGPKAAQIAHLFEIFCRKFHLNKTPLELQTCHFRRPGDQISFLL